MHTVSFRPFLNTFFSSRISPRSFSVRSSNSVINFLTNTNDKSARHTTVKSSPPRTMGRNGIFSAFFIFAGRLSKAAFAAPHVASSSLHENSARTFWSQPNFCTTFPRPLPSAWITASQSFSPRNFSWLLKSISLPNIFLHNRLLPDASNLLFVDKSTNSPFQLFAKTGSPERRDRSIPINPVSRLRSRWLRWQRNLHSSSFILSANCFSLASSYSTTAWLMMIPGAIFFASRGNSYTAFSQSCFW